MNPIRKTILLVALAGLALLFFCPPWVLIQPADEYPHYLRLGHSAVYPTPFPKLRDKKVVVETSRLACETGFILALSGLLCLVASNSTQKS